VKCLVKFFEPEVLKTQDWDDTIVFVQAKLICDDPAGRSELLVEQNDQLVVASTVTNDQTEVTLHTGTFELNDEQEDTFCVAVALFSDDFSDVVAQQCWDDLGHNGKHRKDKGYDNGYD
jgi:hypothetical protein